MSCFDNVLAISKVTILHQFLQPKVYTEALRSLRMNEIFGTFRDVVFARKMKNCFVWSRALLTYKANDTHGKH